MFVDVDQLNWRDTGCELYSSCINCPLPQCRYTLKPKQGIAIDMSLKVEVFAHEGFTSNEIADIFGFSRRTVYRALLRARDFIFLFPYWRTHEFPPLQLSQYDTTGTNHIRSEQHGTVYEEGSCSGGSPGCSCVQWRKQRLKLEEQDRRAQRLCAARTARESLQLQDSQLSPAAGHGVGAR